MSSDPAPQVIDDRLVSLSPADGSQVAVFDVAGPEEVAAAVKVARETQAWWWEQGIAGRRRYLLKVRSLVAERMPELLDLMRAETGKTPSDARTEVATALEHLNWAPKHARRVLGPRRVRTSLVLIDHSAHLEYRPYGVVGVIGPWNYPVLTPMGSIVYALAAGNTVVFKPSEYTPAVGQWLADAVTEVVGRPVLQAVQGFGATGAALCAADVDKLAFTGSTATAKKVYAACAEAMTPVVLECGGKDALIIDRDADVAAAADFALWGGLFNAGQTCIGIERVYVHTEVADRFLARLVERAGALRVGAEPDSQVGPITMPRQLDVIAAHLADAAERGATFALGGTDSVRPPYVHPTIIVDAPEDSRAVREETFGPVLVVNRVASADEALTRANALPYGLGGAVFARADGMRIARGMRSGMTTVNSALAFAGMPRLPFGGVGESGFGRIHGDDGLREFAYAKSIARRRLRQLFPLLSFDRAEKHNRLIDRLMRVRHR
ncbi:aldehyde dehydrogenase [Actinorhabdospora filicis]|uniref:Aldehyde dehydrogenase n=1 Tax=Actinorhabdospora filicis TaxID=1785913 RepID=A0A9W6SGH8_9ACTN|nr:aldehyde dehydrogenase family protein [Actinorhabdospora filicis]GLZ75873.1 aldehyde dehydrogenase [Actinorhabdospora filicis]